MPEGLRPVLAPLDEEVDHARGPTASRVILEYGDYECPYSRQAFREIERVEKLLPGGIRFAFRLVRVIRTIGARDAFQGRPGIKISALAATTSVKGPRAWRTKEYTISQV